MMNKALYHCTTYMFLIITFITGTCKLQSQNIGRFELPHYDQLPNKQIKKIFQDSEGFIWYCTEDGLCRDDGYNIQIFRSDFKTPDVIKHNHITCITEDLSGKIWFGTLRGAYILDKNDYLITPIEGHGFDLWSIDEIKATSDGSVYIATNNKVYRFDARSARLIHSYDIEWQGVPNKVSSFFEDPQTHNLWITLQKGGLCRFDRQQQRFVPFYWPFDTTPTALVRDKNNHFIWLATYGNGLFRFRPDARNSSSIYIPIREGALGSPSAKIIYNLLQDPTSGDLWAGSGDGLCRYKTYPDGSLERSSTPPSLQLENKVFASAIFDHENNLWIAGSNHNSFILSSLDSTIQRYSTQLLQRHGIPTNMDLLIHEDSLIWCLNKQKQLFAYFPNSGKVFISKLSHRRTTPLLTKVRNRKGIYCILKDNIIIRLTFEHNGIQETEIVNMIPFAEADEHIRTLHEDAYGQLWIGTSRNLYRYSLSNHKLEKMWASAPMVNDIITDGRTVFIATENNGLLVIDGQGTKKRIKIAGNCLGLALLPGKILWISTAKGNILHYDLQRNTLHPMDQACGLDGNSIYGITTDREGKLWILTRQTVTIFTPGEQTFSTLRASSPHINMENFLCMYKDSNDCFHIGGTNGYLTVRADAFLDQQKEKEFLPCLTTVTVNSKTRPVSSATTTLELPSSAQDLTLYLSTFTPLHSQNIRFAFRHTGRHEEWNILPQGQNSIHLSQLSKGDNSLEIKSTDANGHWNEAQVQTLHIYRAPWWYETYAAYFLYVLGAVAVLFILIRHVLKRQQAQNQLAAQKQLEEMKYRFFTNISHELRTPLTLIIAPLESLLKKEENPDTRKQLKTIDRNAHNLLSLVNQLLDFRRIEMKGETLALETFNLKDMLSRIYESFLPMSEEKNIRFDFHCHPETFLITADSPKIEKVVNNLLSNAFKFTPQGGHVTLKAYPEPSDGREMAVIQVEDDGIGIPAEEQEHIFERFHQANSHKDNTGSGIGLNVAKEYVQLHNGKIEVSSVPGKGSCFTVRIPVGKISHVPSELLPKVPQQENPVDNSPLPVGSIVLPTILLVEDNDEFRHYLQEELSRHFTVLEASDGEEGETVALQQKPDIIITDLMMPKMDGIELCKRIKHNIEVSHIPVILLTASASVENEERGYKEGADAYMTKPFKWEILTARIHNLLAQRRQQQNEFKQNAEAEAKDVTISPADEEFLNKALRFVEKNMDNSEYSVDELSDDMAMSRATLFRKMRSVIGMSPTDFIRNTRLKRAAQLITEGRLSVAEIAYSVGYSSPGHFTKSFKKEFGVLPTQYHKT